MKYNSVEEDDSACQLVSHDESTLHTITYQQTAFTLYKQNHSSESYYYTLCQYATHSILVFKLIVQSADCTVSWAVLTYLARKYDSAVCCSKMSCDTFLSEALYEADKVLEKFTAVPRECACVQDGSKSSIAK